MPNPFIRLLSRLSVGRKLVLIYLPEALARAKALETSAARLARLRLAYERFREEPAICGLLAPEPAELTAA